MSNTKNQIKVNTEVSVSQSKIINNLYNSLPEFNSKGSVTDILLSNGNCGDTYNSYFELFGSQQILVSEIRNLILVTGKILETSYEKMNEIDNKLAKEIEKTMKVCLI